MYGVNVLPLKMYRACRVFDPFGDKWMTRLGEEMVLPAGQLMQDAEALGMVEVIPFRLEEEPEHGGRPMTLRECMEAEEITKSNLEKMCKGEEVLE